MVFLPGNLRSAPATLACDELESAARERPDKDGLHDAIRGDGCGELGQFALINMGASLIGIAVDLLDRYFARLPTSDSIGAGI